jgi:translation initiation factor IF-2
MKTLTELSGTLVRMAAKAIAEAQKNLPKEAPPAPATEPAPEAAPVEATPAGATGPAELEAGATAEAAAPAPAAPPPPPTRAVEVAEAVESEAVKAVLDAAVSAATGLSGDRLARLRDAVKAAGRKTDDVRLVRVFGVEEPVPGARTINGFQFLVDHAPASMKQVASPGGKEKGGRGGRGGGGGGRGGGGGGGKGGGDKNAPTSGGFSMDSLREDRKNDRSGRGGRPGGGRPGGGRPGGGR